MPAKAKPFKRSNLNDTIRFKITQEGCRFISQQNRKVPFYRRHPISIPVDDKGFSELVLWEFMHIFGPSFGAPGMNPTVVTTFHLKKNA